MVVSFAGEKQSRSKGDVWQEHESRNFGCAGSTLVTGWRRSGCKMFYIDAIRDWGENGSHLFGVKKEIPVQ